MSSFGNVLIIGDSYSTIEDGFEEICRHYGLTYIKFKGLDKISGHPSKKVCFRSRLE